MVSLLLYVLKVFAVLCTWKNLFFLFDVYSLETSFSRPDVHHLRYAMSVVEILALRTQKNT